MSGNSSQKEMIRHTILPSILNVMKARCMNKEIVIFEKIMTIPDYSIIPEWHELCLKIIPDGYWEQTDGYYSEQIAKNKFLDKDNLHMGLQNGLAGCGISLLTKLDGDNSWISLLPDNFYTDNNEHISV